MYDLPKGLKLIAVLRRSKKKQHESIERQRELVRMLMQRIESIQYDEVVLDDHSSTLGQQWDAYYKIIERKRNGEQFDGVCASEYARIGRNMDDCEEYARKLKRAKLKLITHKEGSLIGKDKWLTRIGAAQRTRLAWLLLRGVDFDGITGIVTFKLRIPVLLMFAPELMDELFWSAVTARKGDNGTLKEQNSISLGIFQYRLEPGRGPKPAKLKFVAVLDS